MIRFLLHILAELLWWDWQLVGTFETEAIVKYKYEADKKYKAYIHCFESRWGTRHTRIKIYRPTYLDIGNYPLARRVRRQELFQTEIYPWLHGRWNETIPTFHKVEGGTWDFLKKLKGETPVVLNDDEK